MIKQDGIWSETGDNICVKKVPHHREIRHIHTMQHDVFKEHSWSRDCLGENLNKGWETMSQRNSGNSWRNGGLSSKSFRMFLLKNIKKDSLWAKEQRDLSCFKNYFTITRRILSDHLRTRIISFVVFKFSFNFYKLLICPSFKNEFDIYSVLLWAHFIVCPFTKL